MKHYRSIQSHLITSRKNFKSKFSQNQSNRLKPFVPKHYVYRTLTAVVTALISGYRPDGVRVPGSSGKMERQALPDHAFLCLQEIGHGKGLDDGYGSELR